MELDLGLDGDDWLSIESNLLKDFNKNRRNISINNIDNLVNLADFLSELQSHREEKILLNEKDEYSVSSKLESLWVIAPDTLIDNQDYTFLAARSSSKSDFVTSLSPFSRSYVIS